MSHLLAIILRTLAAIIVAALFGVHLVDMGDLRQ